MISQVVYAAEHILRFLRARASGSRCSFIGNARFVSISKIYAPPRPAHQHGA